MPIMRKRVKPSLNKGLYKHKMFQDINFNYGRKAVYDKNCQFDVIIIAIRYLILI